VVGWLNEVRPYLQLRRFGVQDSGRRTQDAGLRLVLAAYQTPIKMVHTVEASAEKDEDQDEDEVVENGRCHVSGYLAWKFAYRRRL